MPLGFHKFVSISGTDSLIQINQFHSMRIHKFWFPFNFTAHAGPLVVLGFQLASVLQKVNLSIPRRNLLCNPTNDPGRKPDQHIASAGISGPPGAGARAARWKRAGGTQHNTPPSPSLALGRLRAQSVLGEHDSKDAKDGAVGLATSYRAPAPGQR